MTSDVRLRPVEERDLPIFFEQQLDTDAIYMAAFTHKDPADRNAFDAHEGKLHTRQFREALAPMLGAPYDERLYTSP